jgi:hypothetical protein
MLSRMWQGYQFCSILFEMTETFHINLKQEQNGTIFI